MPAARAFAWATAFSLLAGCAYPRASAAGRDATVRPPDVAAPRMDSDGVSVVPQPRSLRLASGVYRWPARVGVVLRGGPAANVAQQLRAYLHENGVVVEPVAPGARAGVILTLARDADPRLGDEGYRLTVRPDGVTLHARTQHGLFDALQTLEQLSTRTPAGLTSHAATVTDWPVYRWRGIELDVARHFFAVPVIERTIEVAAHYKLNVFHWHLTDDQGWRLHSDRYPVLGAGSPGYSRADVRAVVAYAARRYVTVVPEIDLPAHTGAALRAYPPFACGASLCTTGAGLAFARDVLADAAADFPSPYVHAGGDEVPPRQFARQPAFTRAIERSVEGRGRRMVGWDEILRPGLSTRAVVMVWTGPQRVAQAVRQGNEVVVASAPLYFDAAQGDAAQEPRASAHMATLEQVYDDPIAPPGLTASERARVLGAQGNVWTERIATPQRLFSMLLPRTLALAESVWTPPVEKNWDSFLVRLPRQLTWLDEHRFRFRIPNAAFDVSGGPVRFAAVRGHVQSVDALTTARALTVALRVPLDGAAIRYTTDGAQPVGSSPIYHAPFTVRVADAPVVLRAATFFHGRAGATTQCTIVRSTPVALHARRDLSTSWSALVSP